MIQFVEHVTLYASNEQKQLLGVYSHLRHHKQIENVVISPVAIYFSPHMGNKEKHRRKYEGPINLIHLPDCYILIGYVAI